MFIATRKRLLFLCSLGGVLEFYDFIIYALLASYIAADFFPSNNSVSSLLATFTTFSIGYLARPVGGMIFGHFGDRLGRKKAFTISILLMAVSTFCIGLTPSYASIGIAAPIILTILRICQGLSVGGEIPGAISYISESMPEQKGLACGIIFCSLISGIVLGSLIEAILSTSLTKAAITMWGWRIPFYFGGIFGFISYLMRQQLEESALFQAIQSKIIHAPLIMVFKLKLKNIIAAIFIVALGSSLITLLFLFMPSYLSNVVHANLPGYVWYKTLAIFFVALLCIPLGWLTDIYSPKKLVACLALMTLLFAYPIFLIYTQYQAYFGIALLLSALLTGAAWGIIPSILPELFPTRIRYTSVGVSYNIGFAIFGGLTPLIAMFMIYHTGSFTSPTLYLVISALMCLLVLLFVETAPVDSED